jgi:hypothetical protein
MQHPLYSSDLVQADFFLFQKVKLTLKGEQFSDIQRGVTKKLKGVSLQDVQCAFGDLYK